MDPPTSRTRRRSVLLDATAVVACWAFVGFLSTAQRWTWLNTPDAEFYATLGLFGHEVTDRTVTPVYYWTRLGTIAPVRALTEVLGPWAGYHAFWLALVLVIVGAVFVLARRFAGRLVSAGLAVLVCLNTTVLAFLGNPYVTGTAMAAMFVVIAAAVWTAPPDSGTDAGATWPAAVGAPIAAGIGIGWLAMTNPNAMIMTVAVWVAVTVVVTLQRAAGRFRFVLRTVCLALVGAGVAFAVLWWAASVIFPGLDWLQTYLYWSKALNFAAYVGDAWAFTRDISMIVPLVLVVVVLAALAIRPRDRALHLAAVLSPAALGITVAALLLTPNGTLEVGHYQSLQWPPALCGLALVSAAALRRQPATPGALAAGALGVVLTIVAGHWAGTMSLAAGWGIAAVCATAFVAAFAWLVRGDGPVGGVRLVAFVLALAVLMSAFQLLQNARRPTGVMAEGVYSNAYNANDTSARLASGYEAERWLIGQTQPSDTVMVWVDADWEHQEQTLLSMAAFQIWGANQVTPARTFDEAALGNARAAHASVIAMYGRTRAAVIDFWSSIPREVGHSDPVCSTYPWPDAAVPEAHVCLTRLTWP